VPFYNEELDTPGTVPGPARALRDAVQRADALLLATPEYNGSLPAVLKNAIDWISRPYQSGGDHRQAGRGCRGLQWPLRRGVGS
jgi:NAD(P)H-dependent FMN reductase